MEQWPITGLDVDELTSRGWTPTPFQQFILKLHSRCNLSCSYCYLYTLADDGWRTLPRVMTSEIVSLSCQRIVEHVTAHRISRIEVILHGGEPLLAGPAVLADIATTLSRDLPAGTEFDLLVQTNGILLDETMLGALLAHGIRVGISVDGEPDDHDRRRRHADGHGSYAETSKALRLLGTEPYRHLFAGLLCVVDPDTDPVRTYESLLSFAPPRLNFLLPHGNWSIPPPRRAPDSDDTPYGDWLAAAFDRWYDAPSQETEVRIFAEIINLVLGGQSRTESVGLSPVALIAINTDGALEQVDTLRSAYHGAAATGLNVTDNSLDDALRNPAIAARQIGMAALGEVCQRCDLRAMCGGGHYPHRYRQDNGFRNASVYCPDLSRLIRHIDARVRADLDT